MRRLIRDAVLVAATALAVWFVRGDAQQSTPLGYGEPFQLTCTQGEIRQAYFSVDTFGYLSFSWEPRADLPDGVLFDYKKGVMAFTGCTAHPGQPYGP